MPGENLESSRRSGWSPHRRAANFIGAFGFLAITVLNFVQHSTKGMQREMPAIVAMTISFVAVAVIWAIVLAVRGLKSGDTRECLYWLIGMALQEFKYGVEVTYKCIDQPEPIVLDVIALAAGFAGVGFWAYTLFKYMLPRQQSGVK